MFRLFECCALSFFERFVLSFSLKIERFVSDSAEIWICGLYNQQELISRLKFIARLGYKAEELPEFWFNKCVGYLQYIAYNQTDRDDAFIHQEYAAALEMVLRKLNGKAPIPACLSTEPAYGKKVYNMRPDALKMKPKRKK